MQINERLIFVTMCISTHVYMFVIQDTHIGLHWKHMGVIRWVMRGRDVPLHVLKDLYDVTRFYCLKIANFSVRFPPPPPFSQAKYIADARKHVCLEINPNRKATENNQQSSTLLIAVASTCMESRAMRQRARRLAEITLDAIR